MVYVVVANVVALICLGLLAIQCGRQSLKRISGQAATKGLQLLLDNLTPEQHRQYEQFAYFDVVGSESGNRYRIQHGTSLNVRLLTENDQLGTGRCFQPRGSLVAGDCMLAQKIALENCEQEALRNARRF
jgi:hypothetical protein